MYNYNVMILDFCLYFLFILSTSVFYHLRNKESQRSGTGLCHLAAHQPTFSTNGLPEVEPICSKL